MKRWPLLIGLVVTATLAGVGYLYRHHWFGKPLEVGECTWYAVERASEDGWNIRFDQPFGRHARAWPQRVVNGKLTQIPHAGDVMVLDAWKGNPYGHVTYVEEVISPGHLRVSHANMAIGEVSRTLDGESIRNVEVEFQGGVARFAGWPSAFRLIGFLHR